MIHTLLTVYYTQSEIINVLSSLKNAHPNKRLTVHWQPLYCNELQYVIITSGVPIFPKTQNNIGNSRLCMIYITRPRLCHSVKTTVIHPIFVVQSPIQVQIHLFNYKQVREMRILRNIEFSLTWSQMFYLFRMIAITWTGFHCKSEGVHTVVWHTWPAWQQVVYIISTSFLSCSKPTLNPAWHSIQINFISHSIHISLVLHYTEITEKYSNCPHYAAVTLPCIIHRLNGLSVGQHVNYPCWMHS